LELGTLEYIIIPKDFASELVAFQRKRGLREGFTDDDTGSAVAKTLDYGTGGVLKQTIFINSSLFCLDSLEVVSIINHELCHVHDNFMLSKILGLDFVISQSGNLQEVLRMFAKATWSEYAANRLSLRYINNNNTQIKFSTKGFSRDIKIMFERIDKSKKECREHIRLYKKTKKGVRLYEGFQESTSSLLLAIGRTYGSIHGLNFDEIENSINEEIRTYLREICKDLSDELKNLFSKYPNWDGIEALDELANIVLRTWNKMGFYPEDTIKGIHIRVIDEPLNE
jgi:hypothetical protein